MKTPNGTWYVVVCTGLVHAVFGAALQSEATKHANERSHESGWNFYVITRTGRRPSTGDYVGASGLMRSAVNAN